MHQEVDDDRDKIAENGQVHSDPTLRGLDSQRLESTIELTKER